MTQFNLNPMARMVSTMVTQADSAPVGSAKPMAPAPPPTGPNANQQLAAALSKYGDLMIFSPKLGLAWEGAQTLGDAVIKKDIEDAVDQGNLMVMESQQTYQQLVESGEIKPEDSPWLHRAAKESTGILLADRYGTEYAVEYDNWYRQNPTVDHLAIEGFQTDFTRTFNQRNGVEDPVTSAAFHKGIREHHQNVNAIHKSQVDKRNIHEHKVAGQALLSAATRNYKINMLPDGMSGSLEELYASRDSENYRSNAGVQASVEAAIQAKETVESQLLEDLEGARVPHRLKPTDGLLPP